MKWGMVHIACCIIVWSAVIGVSFSLIQGKNVFQSDNIHIQQSECTHEVCEPKRWHVGLFNQRPAQDLSVDAAVSSVEKADLKDADTPHEYVQLNQTDLARMLWVMIQDFVVQNSAKRSQYERAKMKQFATGLIDELAVKLAIQQKNNASKEQKEE